MKPKYTLRAFLLGCSSLLAASSLQAADGTWSADADGSWTEIANWNAGAGPIADGADFTATFDIVITGNRVVTLGGDRTIGNITASDTSHNYTISGANSLTLDVTSGFPDIAVTGGTGRTLTISSDVSSSDGISKSGSGTLLLSGTGTSISGDIEITGGKLQIGGHNATNLGGSYGGNISIASGSELNFYMNGTTQTLTGPISGAGNVRTSGNGALTISGSNTYTGKTYIVPSGPGNPTLSVSSLNSVNGGSPPLATSSLGRPITDADGTIDLGGSSQRSARLIYTGTGETTDRIISLGTNGGSGTTFNTIEHSGGSGVLKFTSPMNRTGSGDQGLGLEGDQDGEIVEPIPNMVKGLKKDGAGTWTLGSDASRYGGKTDIQNGVLSVSHIGDGGVELVLTTNNTITVTTSSTADLAVGMVLSSRAIADDRTIASIVDGTTFTLSGTAGNGGYTTSIGFPGGLGIATSDPAGLVFDSATLQYTGPDASTNRGFTINSGDFAEWDITASTLTVSGDTAATSGRLTKSGAGTLILSGMLQHTGTPNAVSAGTLLINGDASAMTGAVEVAALATFGGSGTIGGNLTVADTGGLTFDLSTAPGGHDKLDVTGALTLPTEPETSELTITSAGGATTGTYTLLTAAGAISGDVPVTVNLPGGWTADAPVIVGNNLQINITSTGGGGSAYDTWAGGAVFTDDDNGDGVTNGVAFLLGAADPDEVATDRLPTVTESGGSLIMTFNCLPVADRGTATLRVEHSSDLGILDPWTATVDVVPDADDAVPDNDVTFVVDTVTEAPLNKITVTIGTAAAAGGKLFGRLDASQP